MLVLYALILLNFVKNYAFLVKSDEAYPQKLRRMGTT